MSQPTQQEKKRNVEVTNTKILPRNSKPLSTPYATPILPSKIEKGWEDLASQFADSIYNGNEGENEEDGHFSTPFHFQTSPLEALSKEAFSTKKQIPRTPVTKPSPFIDEESSSIDESHIDVFSTIQSIATTTSTTTTSTSSQEKGHIGHENNQSHANSTTENLNMHDLGRRKTMSTPYKTPPRSLSMDYIINTSKEDEDSLFENNTNVDFHQEMLFSPNSPLPSSFGVLGNKEVTDDLDWTKYMENADKFDDFDIDS